MDASRCNIALIAAEPEALVELCGVSLLERLLRTLQRLGSRRAIIISPTPREIQEHLAAPSWPRAELVLDFRQQCGPELSAGELRKFFENTDGLPNEATLLINAGSYYDARLLTALMARTETLVLADRDPPPALWPLLNRNRRNENSWTCGAAVMTKAWLAGLREDALLVAELFDASAAGTVATLDVSQEPTYVVDLRRDLRPLSFPAPRQASQHRLAEAFLLDAAQNGVLDLPAKVHAPLETWIIARLCKTSITANQITFCTAILSIIVTVLFAWGKLPAGTLLALAVGVLDGLDGKQARVKVETTDLGKKEHVVDYALELSWWAALTHHFATTRQLPNASGFLALLVASDLLDRCAKKFAKKQTGRNLDDVAPIDRLVRLIGGRRNIYVWLLGGGLLLGAPEKAFALFCVWAGATAAAHVLRAFWIARA